MIYYPIETLVNAGCRELLIVSGPALGELAQLVKNGQQWGLSSVMYAYQDQPDGIAGALKLARNFVGHEKCCVVLGDNLILDDLTPHIKHFEDEPENTCKLFIKELPNPSAFGVAEITNGQIRVLSRNPRILLPIMQ